MPKAKILQNPIFFWKLIQLSKRQKWLAREDKMQAVEELWSLCKNKKQKNLVYKLLDNFRYVEISERAHIITVISNKIKNDWNLSHNNTILLSMKDDKGIPDSSRFLHRELAPLLTIDGEWDESENFRTMGNFPHSNVVKNNSDINIVLVDDFCGTGGTLRKAVKQRLLPRIDKVYKKNPPRITVYVAFFAAMEGTKNIITECSEKHYIHFWLKKGISDNFIKFHVHDNIKNMKNMEAGLIDSYNKNHLKNFHLGYNKTEALWGIDSAPRASNNVFPIFWWPKLKSGLSRKTILPPR